MAVIEELALRTFFASPTLSILVVFLLGVTFLSYVLPGAPKPPEDLPWVGIRNDEVFAKKRAVIRAFYQTRDWLSEGYHKYSKKGKSYIFPAFSSHHEVIIPKEKVGWLLDYPDHVASTQAAHYDALYGDYSFTKSRILTEPYHEHVIYKSLARNMQGLIPSIQEELAATMDETWGTTPGEWKEIGLFSNMMYMIARVSNRMFVGLPLCRNETYGRCMAGFAQSVIQGCIVMNMFTAALLPIIGPIATLPNQYYAWRARRFTKPIIAQRKKDLLRQRDDPDFKWEAPNDYITWHLKLAMAEGNAQEFTADSASIHLLPINFAAIHTTVLTIISVMLDLHSSSPDKGYLDGIREEVERVFATTDGTWNKSSLAQLVRTDSAIRESMRVSNFLSRGLLRKIVTPDGIHEPQEDFTVPFECMVGTDVHSIHHDAEIYPDPNGYDAFRFSRPVEEAMERQARGETLNDTERLRLKQLGIVTTSDHFLTFGHGRHACPGRFFVSHELKMLLAYMVLHYDVEPIPVRPPNKWVGQHVIPPRKATIRVRRRAGKA